MSFYSDMNQLHKESKTRKMKPLPLPPTLNQGKTRDEIMKSLTKWSVLKKEFSSINKRSNYPPSTTPTIPAIPRSIKPDVPVNTYSTNSILVRLQESPSYSFSKETRFDNSIYEKLKNRIFCSSALSKDRLNNHHKMIENRDMSRYSPIKKQKKIEEVGESTRFLNAVVKLTRTNIIQRKKEEQESKLRLKYNKLEIRLKKGLLNDIKSTWILLTAFMALASQFQKTIKLKKKLKQSVSRFMKKFRIYARAVGTFIVLLYKKRKNSNLSRIYSQVTLKIKELVLNKRLNQTILIQVLEKFIGVSTFTSAIHLIRQKVIKAQSRARSFLTYRHLLYTSLLQHWKIIEKKFHQRSNGKGRRSVIRTSKEMTDISKVLVIRSFINNKIKESTNLYNSGVPLSEILSKEFHLDPSLFTF